MLKEKKGVVSIWVGTLASKADLAAYVKERSSRGDDDDKPISRFAADCDETFYDHDFIESAHAGKKPLPISQLVEKHSYGRSFAAAAQKLASKAGIETANAVILLYGQQLSPPRWPKKALLRHLGSVPFSFSTPMKEQALDKYRGHDSRVMQIGFTPDSKHVITADDDGSALAWDSATGRVVTPPRQVFEGVGAGPYGLTFTADGSRCLLYTLFSSRLWADFPSADGLRKECKGRCTVMSQDGTTGFATRYENIEVFDLMTGKPMPTLPIAANEMAIFKDQLLAIDDQAIVTLRDLRKKKQSVHEQPPLSSCAGLEMPPGGIAVAWDDQHLAGFDVSSKKWRWTVKDCRVKSVAVGKTKKMLIVPSKEPAAVLEWDTGRRLKSLDSGKIRYSQVAISHDEQRGLGVDTDGKCLDLWQLSSGKLLARCDTKSLGKSRDGISTAAISADGNTVVAGTFGGRVLFLRWNGKALVSQA